MTLIIVLLLLNLQPYEEELDVGLIGIVFLGRSVPVLKVPSKLISISNSADIIDYFRGKYQDNEKKRDFLIGTKEVGITIYINEIW